MELARSNVVFDQENHTYFLGEKQLSGITFLLNRQFFGDKYTGIPEFVLEKARVKGTLVHEACELIDTLGVEHDSAEAWNYIRLKNENDLRHEASEYLVSDEKNVASCIDKVFRVSETEFALADIKTTYKLDKEYVRWQLSIYAYLFEKQNPGAKAGKLYAIWLRGSVAELVEVERIPDDIIVSLLETDARGEQFANPYAVANVDETLPCKYQEMEEAIKEIDNNVRYWSEQRDKLMEGVQKEMIKAGVYKWQGNGITFIRRKDSIRKNFDKKAFEKDHADLYKQYLTETPIIGSVTLKVS